MSARQIEQSLKALELKASELSGIFVTHEHADHIKALGVLSRKYGIPIYASLETLRALMQVKSLGELQLSCLNPILPDMVFCLGDLKIQPFTIAHDAAHPLAYRVSSERASVAVATDMGSFDAYTKSNLEGLDALLLEANHDPGLLARGPYPMLLKRRILSDRGHLSNELSGELLAQVLHPKIQKILLGHLSQENNEPKLALSTVRACVDAADNPYGGKDFDISIALRDGLSPLLQV